MLQSLRIFLPAFTIVLAALAIFYGYIIFRYIPNGRAIYKINTYGRKGLTKTETIGPSWLKIAVPDKYLERVTHICLSGMRKPVTDADLRILNGLTNLKSLILADTRLTDAGLTHLAQMQQLTHLAINNTAITDAGLVHLKGLTNLKELDLKDTNVVGHGLVKLQHLSSLKELHLGLTPLADVGIEHINALTSLEVIQLQYTNVTDGGISDLNEKLPGVSIRNSWQGYGWSSGGQDIKRAPEKV